MKREFIFKEIEEGLHINEHLIFPDENFLDSEIMSLENVEVDAEFINKDDDKITFKGKISGTMYLEDAISLENITYNFSADFEEILENNEKPLDIMDILWQNIVLEVPLKLTEVKDFSSYQGDGWKLVSEEELKIANNPFSELKSIIGEE